MAGAQPPHTGYTMSPVNQATHPTLVTLEAGGGQIVARGRNVFGVSQPSPAQPRRRYGYSPAQRPAAAAEQQSVDPQLVPARSDTE